MRVFVEVGPRPILTSYVRDVLREAGTRGIVVETIDRRRWPATLDPIERAASKIALARRQDRDAAVLRPCTSYRRSFCRSIHGSTRISSCPRRMRRPPPCCPARTPNPLLGVRPAPGQCRVVLHDRSARLPWIADHKVGDVSVLPATGLRGDHAGGRTRDPIRKELWSSATCDILRPLVFDGEDVVRDRPSGWLTKPGIVELLSRQRGGGAGADWTLTCARHHRTLADRWQRLPVLPDGAGPCGHRPQEQRICLGQRSRLRLRPSVPAGPAGCVSRVEICNREPRPARSTCDADTQVIDITALDAAFHALFASRKRVSLTCP